jgi:hypothetical protein
MQLFSEDAMVFSKKFNKNNLTLKQEKMSSKVASNFFFGTGLLPKRPKNRNPVPLKAPNAELGS